MEIKLIFEILNLGSIYLEFVFGCDSFSKIICRQVDEYFLFLAKTFSARFAYERIE